MHTDPIADMLTRIRNGVQARHDRIDVPYSTIKEDIAAILKREGFLEDYRKVAGRTESHSVLEVKLRYDDRRQPVITDIRRMSTPGLRRYMKIRQIPTVRNGLGVVILTTSKGLMTDREAKKNRIGGEALCAVW